MTSLAPTYLVFFDGHCRLCTDGKRRMQRMRSDAELKFIDIQDWSQLRQHPRIDPAAAFGQMHVITPTGTVAGGFDALVALMPAFPALRPFHGLMRWPPLRRVGHRAYKWLARNRYRIAGRTGGGCADGACKIA